MKGIFNRNILLVIDTLYAVNDLVVIVKGGIEGNNILNRLWNPQ